MRENSYSRGKNVKGDLRSQSLSAAGYQPGRTLDPARTDIGKMCLGHGHKLARQNKRPRASLQSSHSEQHS